MPVPAPTRCRLRGAALTLSVSAVLISSAPGAAWAAPASEPGAVGPGDTVVGEVVRAYVDDHPEQPGAAGHADDAPLLTWVQPEDGDAVRVPSDDLASVPVGATVSVTVGGRVRDEATVEAGLAPARVAVATEVLAAADAAPPVAAASTVTNQVTVVMVRPGGVAQDATTLAEMISTVNGPVASFWASQSNNTIRLGVTASRNWLTTTATCANPYALWQEVAGKVGFTSGPGKHLVLHVSSAASDCSSGLGTIGSGPTSGGYLYVDDTQPSGLAHEFGHNFGLGHSAYRRCLGAMDSGSCWSEDYGDAYDVMGYSWSELGTLNPVQAALIGLLPAAQVRTVDTTGAGGTFTLGPAGGTSGIRALKVTDSTLQKTYYLEYRAAVGRDAWLADPYRDWLGLQAGVLLRSAPGRGSGLFPSSYLLDPTPTETQLNYVSEREAAFPVNTPVRFSGGDLEVRVTGVTATAATVQVTVVRRTPPPPPPPTPIAAKYAASGGAAGALGAATSAEVCGLTNGGCTQTFRNGAIYWSKATGAHVVSRPEVRTKWAAARAEQGWLGYPTGDTTCGLRSGGCTQAFTGGAIAWSKATGARFVRGAIGSLWQVHGWETGLGYPTADEKCGLRNGGCLQTFTGGSIYWTTATGASFVRGAIRDKWAALRWERGALGYPITNEICGRVLGGCFQGFQGGTVWWSPRTGAHTVWGAIRDAWMARHQEFGPLGYPTTDEYAVPGGVAQRFQHGTLTYSFRTGRVR